MVPLLSLKEGGPAQMPQAGQALLMPEPFHFASEHGSEGAWASPLRIQILAGQFPGLKL